MFLCGFSVFIQSGLRRVELSAAPEQQNLVAGLEFFVGAGIDDFGAVAFDADDAGAGPAAQFEFADHFAESRRAAGQDLVEYVFVLPFMLFFIMAIFDFGRATFYFSSMNNAAREGAREGIVAPNQCNTTAVKNVVRDRALGMTLVDTPPVPPNKLTPNTGVISVVWQNVDVGNNCTPTTFILGNAKVEVGIHYCFKPLTPFVSAIINSPGGSVYCEQDQNTIPMVTSTTMTLEQ